MTYSIQIDRVGADGLPIGLPAMHAATSQSEAIKIMRRAIQLARPMMQSMQFNIYGPGNQLLLSYTSEAQPACPQTNVEHGIYSDAAEHAESAQI